MSTEINIRVATAGDLPEIQTLIPLSVRGLSAGHYTPEQIESAIRHVFGADTQLIADGTYFVAEDDGVLVGCGGWSRRRTLYGGDQVKASDDPPLDPAIDPARIRAFFVHPGHGRRGIASRIMHVCMDAARAAGFHAVELASTLPGVPLYRAFGFQAVEPFDYVLPDGVPMPLVRMARAIGEDP